MRSYLLCFGILSVGTVFADGGFYGGIGVGYANLDNTAQNNYMFNNGSSGTQSIGSLASTLYFGYDFNRYIGTQLEYNTAYAGQIANSYNIRELLPGASLLLHLPFGLITKKLDGFDIYAKGGGAYNTVNFRNVQPTCVSCVNPPSSVTSLVPSYGAGLEYAPPQSFGARLEWNSYGNVNVSNQNSTQVVNSADMYLFSILYHF